MAVVFAARAALKQRPASPVSTLADKASRYTSLCPIRGERASCAPRGRVHVIPARAICFTRMRANPSSGTPLRSASTPSRPSTANPRHCNAPALLRLRVRRAAGAALSASRHRGIGCLVICMLWQHLTPRRGGVGWSFAEGAIQSSYVYIYIYNLEKGARN